MSNAQVWVAMFMLLLLGLLHVSALSITEQKHCKTCRCSDE